LIDRTLVILVMPVKVGKRVYHTIVS
jgi:hypothetical protein